MAPAAITAPCYDGRLAAAPPSTSSSAARRPARRRRRPPAARAQAAARRPRGGAAGAGAAAARRGAHRPSGAVCYAAPAAATALVPATGDWYLDNFVFLAGFVGWFVAQFSKIFTKALKTGRLDPMQFVASGGMPSSHSALCMGVTTAIALQYGTAGPLFPLGLGFSLIVMYDACNVRRHAGLQAEVLNKVVKELFNNHALSDRGLKEILGHTPLQVFCGLLTGVASAFVCKWLVGL